MGYETPGGMFQRFTVREKGDDHKWDRDAVTQAYIERDGNLKIPISGVEGKTVKDFLAKDDKTLKYFGSGRNRTLIKMENFLGP